MAQPRKTKNTTQVAFSNRLLQKAFTALWKRTDEAGVCKGNGKIPTLRSELGLSEAQANHIVQCLQELGLLSWNGKRGMGAAYTVVVEQPTITAAMAKQALAVVGPFPKAKLTRSAPAKTPAKSASKPVEAKSSPEEPNLEAKVQGLIDAAERLLAEIQTINEDRLRVIAENAELRQENESFKTQITQLNAELERVRKTRDSEFTDLMGRIDLVLEQEALVTARPSSLTH